MKMNKVQKQNTMRFYVQWKASSWGFEITENNAFMITEGLVGEQGSTKIVRLIDVAAKYAVIKFPPKKRKIDLTSV